MPIKLGDKVVDMYNGYKGLAVSRTEYLHGQFVYIGVEPVYLINVMPVDPVPLILEVRLKLQ